MNINISQTTLILFMGSNCAIANESISEKYKSTYCENPRFLVCANIKQEKCFKAVEMAVDTCNNEFGDIYGSDQPLTDRDKTFYHVCMISELTSQDELNNKESKTCIVSPEF